MHKAHTKFLPLSVYLSNGRKSQWILKITLNKIYIYRSLDTPAYGLSLPLHIFLQLARCRHLHTLENAALYLRPVSKYSVTCSIYSDCNKWGLLNLFRLRILFTLVFYLYLSLYLHYLTLDLQFYFERKKSYYHYKNHNDTCTN